MSADRVNPNFEGFVTARGYKIAGATSGEEAINSKFIYTNGTTEVDVFGATNGCAGSVVAVKVIPRDATQAKYTLYSGYSDHRTAIATVIKTLAGVPGLV